MGILCLIVVVIILFLSQSKKCRIIFEVYRNQYRRYRNGTPCNAQHSSFKDKHVESLNIIRNIHFNNSECVRLPTPQASELDEHLQNCYQEGVVPFNVTIMLTQPTFSSYKHFFGDCYYTINAIPFYEYKIAKKMLVKCNQQLFVCFTNTERNPLEIHMCDQRSFSELLEYYNKNIIFWFIICAVVAYVS
uniref:Uncharacterized protein n=1 Tax=Tetranychus urticae TaxID=32264 RepID=T1JPS2_TETUR